MRSRKVFLSTVIAASLGVAAPFAAQAQQMPAAMGVAAVGPGEALVAGTVRREATVMGINPETRTVVLKGQDGRVFMVTCGDQVRNFAQIRVGDRVVSQYVSSLSLSLKKHGDGIREMTEKEDSARAALGEKPAGAVGRQVTILANVVGVDAKKQLVTLLGPDGNKVDLRVQDPAQLKNIKKGDQVEAVYTEALAIAVEPAAPAKTAPPAKK